MWGRKVDGKLLLIVRNSFGFDPFTFAAPDPWLRNHNPNLRECTRDHPYIHIRIRTYVCVYPHVDTPVQPKLEFHQLRLMDRTSL